jgi:NAD(P)-dependent dehydrogenase (short-subunit alcohol dehydrogenase family)
MPTALITGASSGIGLATVEAVAASGRARVVATVRSEDDAAMVRERQRRLGHPVDTDLLDLTDHHQIDRVVGRHHPTVIVNVAGDAALGPVLDADDDEVQGAIDQHLIGPMRLATAAVEHMRSAGSGRIVNVGSALARTSVPMTGWYAAVEGALASLTESLRAELADEPIDVVLVELGAVDTPAWDAASAPDSPTGARWACTTRLLRPLFPEPADAARTVAAAALDDPPKLRYRAGFGPGLLAASGRLPRRVRARALGAVFGG